MSDLVTVSQLSRMLQLSKAFLYQEAAAGRIPCVRIRGPGCGRRRQYVLRFDATAVLAAFQMADDGPRWEAGQTVVPPPSARLAPEPEPEPTIDEVARAIEEVSKPKRLRGFY